MFVFGFMLNITFAQLPDDLSNYKSSQINDEQLKKYVDQASKTGMTQDQLLAEIRKKGLPESEIVLLTERIKNLQGTSNNAGTATTSVDVQQTRVVATNATNVSTVPSVIKNKKELPIFGADLFSTSNTSFEPPVNIPTPLNYKLGARDELIIDVYGENDRQQKTTISPDGYIRLAYVGQIFLTGLTIEEATARIRSKLLKVYPGLASGKTKLSVSLGNIKTIKITIIGNAVKPGSYSVSSLATVFNALYLSGGPDPNGSFREIELIRNSKVIQNIDVYQYLLRGSRFQDVRLEDMDIINIPFVKIKVSLSGEVKKAAIFEMLPNETLSSLLQYAGGFKDGAYRSLIKAERFTNSEKKILDIKENEFKTLKLVSGDSYLVEAILDKYENKVSIKGSVFRPGSFAFTTGMRLKDLVAKAEGFKEDVYLDKAIIYRLREDKTKEISSISLRSLDKDSPNNILLKKDDEVVVSSIFDFVDENGITIVGAVRNPGAIDFRENIALKDLIQIRGGLREDAYTGRASITRRRSNGTTVNFDIDLNNMLSGDSDLVLKRNDVVYIASTSEMKDKATVSIYGEVHRAGTFPFSDSLSLKGLVLLAGGFTDLASIENIEIARRRNDVDPTNKNSILADVIKLSLDTTDLAFDKKSIKLLPYDIVSVRRTPFKRSQQTVRIEGQVLYPGDYPITSRQERLSDLIKRAGGLIAEANIHGARLNRLRDGNERTDKAQVDKISKQANDSTGLLTKTYDKAVNEIVIDLAKALKNPGGNNDITLEPGDRLFVTKFEPMVEVNGEVLRPVRLNYVAGRGMKYYISAAAGFVGSAQKNKTFVVYPNGKAAQTKHILGIFRKYPEIEPGSQVFVPKVPERKGTDYAKAGIIISAVSALITAFALAYQLTK